MDAGGAVDPLANGVPSAHSPFLNAVQFRSVRIHFHSPFTATACEVSVSLASSLSVPGKRAGHLESHGLGCRLRDALPLKLKGIVIDIDDLHVLDLVGAALRSRLVHTYVKVGARNQSLLSGVQRVPDASPLPSGPSALGKAFHEVAGILRRSFGRLSAPWVRRLYILEKCRLTVTVSSPPRRSQSCYSAQQQARQQGGSSRVGS